VGFDGIGRAGELTVFGREVIWRAGWKTVSGRGRISSARHAREIIQDDSTLALSCKALPPEKVKGIREPVRIYEVPWREDGQPVRCRTASHRPLPRRKSLIRVISPRRSAPTKPVPCHA